MIIAIVTKHVKNLWEARESKWTSNGQPQNGQPQNGQPQNGQPQNGQPQGIAPTGDIQMIICVIWWGI